MISHEPFLATILDRPDDERPRLIYADWLEEQGDPRAEWLRLTMAIWAKARDITVFPHDFDIVETWRERLNQHDPSGRLALIWVCNVVRFQPLTMNRRFGDLLDAPAGRAALATAEMAACELVDEAACENVHAQVMNERKRVESLPNPLFSLAYRSVCFVAMNAIGDALLDAAVAADLSGVQHASSRRWQSALARLLLDQPLPFIDREPDEVHREDQEKTEAVIGVRREPERGGLG